MSFLVPSFDITGYAFVVNGERQSSGQDMQDFSSSLTYALYSLDGEGRAYVVTVLESTAYFTHFDFLKTDNTRLSADIEGTVSGNSVWFYLTHEISLNGLIPAFATYLDMNDGLTVTSASAGYDFTNPLIFRVYEAGGSVDQDYMDYQISAYRLTDLTFTGSANGLDSDYQAYLEDSSIRVELPPGTDVTSLIPDYTFLGDTVTFDGVVIDAGIDAVDFTAPVEVVVNTGTGLSHTYSVTVVLSESPVNPANDPASPTGTGSDAGSFGDGSAATTVPNLESTESTASSTDIDFEIVTVGFNAVLFRWGGIIDQTVSSLYLYALKDGATVSSAAVEAVVTDYTFEALDAETEYTFVIQAVSSDDTVVFRYAVDLTTLTAGGSDICYETVDAASELKAIADDTSKYNGDYMLMFDVSLSDYTSGTGWTPIGTYDSGTAVSFTGSFDGGGHTVSDLYILNSGTYGQGLFGNNSGTIINLGIADCNIYGADTTGALVGYNSGTIRSCYVTGYGTVRADDGDLGGLIGNNYGGTVRNCYTMAAVDGGGPNVGGVVGNNSAGGTVDYCYATGTVVGESKVGGVVGYNNSTYVRYCHHDNDSSKFNGITVGQNDSSATGNSGLSTANMTDSDNVTTNYSGWDFTDIWAIDPSINDGYPYLINNPPAN